MMDQLFKMDGKVVAITGGLGIIGQTWVRALLKLGARVAVLDAQVDDKRIAALFPEATPAQFLAVRVDVTQRESIESACEQIKAKWEVPHGLVNAAAIDTPPDAPATENGPFESYPESSLDKIMDVNVKGVVQCCQVIGGEMAKAGRGSIINISSIYGLVSPDQRIYEYRRTAGDAFFKPVTYCISKSALLNLTRYLATYWAPQGVRVNTLSFGGYYNKQDDKFLAGYTAKVPLGRMARDNEYVGPMIFLLSEAASYMTGANLIVDGGWTAW